MEHFLTKYITLPEKKARMKHTINQQSSTRQVKLFWYRRFRTGVMLRTCKIKQIPYKCFWTSIIYTGRRLQKPFNVERRFAYKSSSTNAWSEKMRVRRAMRKVVHLKRGIVWTARVRSNRARRGWSWKTKQLLYKRVITKTTFRMARPVKNLTRGAKRLFDNHHLRAKVGEGRARRELRRLSIFWEAHNSFRPSDRLMMLMGREARKQKAEILAVRAPWSGRRVRAARKFYSVPLVPLPLIKNFAITQKTRQYLARITSQSHFQRLPQGIKLFLYKQVEIEVKCGGRLARTLPLWAVLFFAKKALAKSKFSLLRPRSSYRRASIFSYNVFSLAWVMKKWWIARSQKGRRHVFSWEEDKSSSEEIEYLPRDYEAEMKHRIEEQRLKREEASNLCEEEERRLQEIIAQFRAGLLDPVDFRK